MSILKAYIPYSGYTAYLNEVSELLIKVINRTNFEIILAPNFLNITVEKEICKNLIYIGSGIMGSPYENLRFHLKSCGYKIFSFDDDSMYFVGSLKFVDWYGIFEDDDSEDYED